MNPEQEYGITFADLGIDTGRCRHGAEYCKVICPQCAHTHSPGKQNDTDVRVNLRIGKGHCFRCGYSFSLENEAYKRDGWQSQLRKGARKVTTQPRKVETPPITAATPVADEGRELPRGIDQWALDYLRDRGITAATAEAFGLRSRTYQDKEGQTVRALYYPYRNEGKLVNVKRRDIDRKKFGQAPGGAKSLYNIDRAAGNSLVVIAEGEQDVLALHEAGWTAVSLQDGAPGAVKNSETGEITVGNPGRKLDGLYETKAAATLQAATRIVIAVDDDLEGWHLREALIERLGAIRCWTVEYPDGCKDASDVLEQFGSERLDDVMAHARPVDVEGITDFGTKYPELHGIWLHGYDRGVSTGWANLDEYTSVRKGTLTSWTGIPGNGKTTLVLGMAANTAHIHDWKWALFTPEAGDDGTLYGKLVQMCADAPILPEMPGRMTEGELQKSAEWVRQHFWRIDTARADTFGYQVVTLPEIIERAEMLVLREGISGLIIDPWNRLEACRQNGQTETEYVAWAINMLSRFAQRHKVAVHVVAHPHKMDVGKDGEDEPMPSPYNIAGSAHWYNMSDVVIGVKRNKWTEPINMTTVRVWKTREEGVSGDLGSAYFNYNGLSRRFLPNNEPMPEDRRPFYSDVTIPTPGAGNVTRGPWASTA